jgi:hypothetical protein
MNKELIQKLFSKSFWDEQEEVDIEDFISVEEFTELIVRKCARICIEKNVSNLDMDVLSNSGPFTIQDLATKSCGENLAKAILKEFDIK